MCVYVYACVRVCECMHVFPCPQKIALLREFSLGNHILCGLSLMNCPESDSSNNPSEFRNTVLIDSASYTSLHASCSPYHMISSYNIWHTVACVNLNNTESEAGDNNRFTRDETEQLSYEFQCRQLGAISGFRRGINEIFALLGYYSTYIGSYGRFGTTCRSHLQGSSSPRIFFLSCDGKSLPIYVV